MRPLLVEGHDRLKHIRNQTRHAEWQQHILQQIDKPYEYYGYRHYCQDAYYAVKGYRFCVRHSLNYRGYILYNTVNVQKVYHVCFRVRYDFINFATVKI